MSQTVLIADDHTLVRAGLRALLEGLPEVGTVIEAGNGREALTAIAAHRPAVVLMDIAMPELNGLEAAAIVSRDHPATRTIVLSMHGTGAYVLQALRAGAAGYLLKDESIERLAELLRQTMQGKPPLSAPIATRLLGYFHEPDVPATTSLTQREQEVLTLLAKGLTIGDVARALEITPNTAASYTKSLYRKLEVTNRAEATLEATRRGLIRL